MIKPTLLLLYMTREGQTQKIIEHIEVHLQDEFTITKINLDDAEPENIDLFDAIIVGCSIRYGYYPTKMKQYLNAHAPILEKKQNAFFGVNLVARKPNKNTSETNLYTKKFLQQLSWKPSLTAVFAGALYYPKYNWFDRNMIRLIMWLGKGETKSAM